MKTKYWLRRSAALVCLTATLQFTLGRAEGQTKPPETVASAQPVAKAPSGSAYQLEIRGYNIVRDGKGTEATLANVVDALRELWTGANIVLAPEVAKVPVTDLKLRSVAELDEALEAVRVASGYKFEWRRGMPAAAGALDPATGLPSRRPAGQASESSLYFLDLGVDPQGMAAQRARRMLEVFNMSSYIEHLPNHDQQAVDKALEGVEQTVNSALAFLRGGNAAETGTLIFQFHPGTGLLIVTGPADGIEVARKIMFALTGQTGDPGTDPLKVNEAIRAASRDRMQDRMQERYGPHASGGMGGGMGGIGHMEGGIGGGGGGMGGFGVMGRGMGGSGRMGGGFGGGTSASSGGGGSMGSAGGGQSPPANPPPATTQPPQAP